MVYCIYHRIRIFEVFYYIVEMLILRLDDLLKYHYLNQEVCVTIFLKLYHFFRVRTQVQS